MRLYLSHYICISHLYGVQPMHLISAHVPITDGIDCKRMFLYSMQKIDSFSRRMRLYIRWHRIQAHALVSENTILWVVQGSGGSVVEAVATNSNPQVVGSNLVPCLSFLNYIARTTLLVWILHMDDMDWSPIMDNIST